MDWFLTLCFEDMESAQRCADDFTSDGYKINIERISESSDGIKMPLIAVDIEDKDKDLRERIADLIECYHAIDYFDETYPPDVEAIDDEDYRYVVGDSEAEYRERGMRYSDFI